MIFTDFFIKRPIFSSVISILILLFGLRAINMLPLRQFPKLENTVIRITTGYAGADANLIQGFITTPLEKAIAQADGIDYLTASSTQNSSSIEAHVILNYDPNNAMTNIMAKVAEVRNDLPQGSNEPIIQKETGDQLALMYIGFSSNKMSTQQITDYVSRVIQPQLQTIPGVSEAKLLGGTTYAMRIWLNPEKMSAYHLSPTEVVNALKTNHIQTAAGQTKGTELTLNISAQTDLHDAKAFEEIIIKQENNAFVRVKDIARIELGAEDYDTSVIFNGEGAVFIGLYATPAGNPLTMIDAVRKILPTLERDYPAAFKSKIVYDATQYIRSSIKEVIKTIIAATAIVFIVIFLFLGAFRIVTIPMVTIPLCLIGVCSLLMVMGYSINLLTLLAMVFAIGLVVDDAIVVVENIYRHVEEGLTPFEAAIQGAREIASPVISMTLTLAAVYAPIGFMTGLTGILFTEFAFTLAFSVMISGIIALTLSPMMCSKILNQQLIHQPFVQRVDNAFSTLKKKYQRLLAGSLNYRPVTVVFAIIMLISCFLLAWTTPSELAPPEDQGFLFVSAKAPQNANLNYLSTYTHSFNAIYEAVPEKEDYFSVNQNNMAFSGIILKPWEKRNRSDLQIQAVLQNQMNQVTGLETGVIQPSPIPGNNGGFPIAFVLTSTQDYRVIYDALLDLKKAAQESGLFLFLTTDLDFNNPQLNIQINREKAAALGINMQDISNTLTLTLGGNYINRFSIEGRSYKVIPQVPQEARLNPEQLKNIYVNTASGELMALDNIVTFTNTIEPNQLNQFQQLNSATVQGVMAPGVTISQALHFLEKSAEKLLPHNISYDYAGQSRQFIQEGNTMAMTFFFSLMIIFLVLAAQFESFRDPFIILISVPLSIAGALIPLQLGAATLNIYTGIGLVTLIGLISKHGILMVQFANQLQITGKTIHDAIVEAASLRLRPILMTTAATSVGVLPLVFAHGASAASRFGMGLVIFSGMLIGTCFTLFVVPTLYSLLAKNHSVGNL